MARSTSPSSTKHISAGRDAVSFFKETLRHWTMGNRAYKVWVGLLLLGIALGVLGYVQQTRHGLVVTAMTDQVSWGAYIANFTFLVGLAAAAVMVVIPAYVYKHSAFKEIVFIGELLAIASVVMCLGFVVVDLGRPDRFWHLLPPFGIFNFPASMLSWDVVVLNGYLVINVYLVHHHLFAAYRGAPIAKNRYIPIVFISMVWAVSIHTVTAFLYAGLGGRPFWNTAVVAPRFLASAFVSGPAFLIVALQVIRKQTGFAIRDESIHALRRILAVTMLINVFLVGAELFKEFYSQTAHTASATYMLFGLHGHDILVPYIWTALVFNVVAALVFVTPPLARRLPVLNTACVMAFIGIWIEKGMGLIVPGFIPTPMGEVVDYAPSLMEFFVSVGIWSLGLLVFTLLLKIAIPVEAGWLRAPRRPWLEDQ